MITKPALLTVEDAKQLDVSETSELFCKHMNRGQFHFLKLLGFHRVLIDTAEGMYLIDKDGHKILDFFAGFGALGFGHNNPRILKVRKMFQEEKRHDIALAFMSQYATALSKNLALIAPGDLDICFLCCSGSEAVEAALKLAEKYQGPEKAKIAYAKNSFHGKTRGALSVTDGELYQSSFQLLDKRICVPFAEAEALENAFRKDPTIGILILETIQGGAGIIMPPKGYLKDVRSISEKYNVLWIADEVQSGMGRTGRFFAFEHEDVVPDIVVMAKSLGGGKSAIGAMISRSQIYQKAYGSTKTALIHSPATFGEMGETCCTAIEALNILYDEGLIENAAKQGDYLLEKLESLKIKFPKMIKEIRGKGLMIGVEFYDISNTMPTGISRIVSVLDNKLKGSLCGFVGSLLLKKHNILVAFTEYNRNVIRLEPPLIVSRSDIDNLYNSFDDLLSKGVVGIVSDYIKHFLN